MKRLSITWALEPDCLGLNSWNLSLHAWKMGIIKVTTTLSNGEDSVS